MGRVVLREGKLADLARIRAEGRREHTMLIPPMKEQALARASMPDPDRDPSVIHPSEMCKDDWCIRATYWRIIGRQAPGSTFNWTTENIFAKGNYTHRYFQELLADTGELFGSWYCQACHEWVHNALSADLPGDDHLWEYKEVRLRGGPHDLINGKADAGFRDTIGEFKTVGLGTIRKDSPKMLARFYHKDIGVYDLDGLWKQLVRPFHSHVKQGNTYLYLAREMGLPFTAVNYVYEFKPNQQTKEFRVTYSEEIMAPLLLRAQRIADAIYEDGNPPDCEFGGCEQCRSYETGTEEPERPARRIVTRRAAEAGSSESGRATRQAGVEYAAVTRGPDGPCGSRAYEDDDEIRPVVEVPGLSAQRSGGRREVRRVTGRETRRSSADKEQGRIGQRNESQRVGRR